MTDKIQDQILAIRASGKYNMFDVISVQREAHERGFYELVLFIEEHKKEYSEFILTGVCTDGESSNS
jgi:biopolymer transport protein ExbD